MVKDIQPLRLDQFRPKSELVVERQTITKPKFPVIDAHVHYGPLTNGENYAQRYDAKAEMEKLQETGIFKVVQHELLAGPELERLLQKIDPYHDFFVTYGSVDLSKFEDPNFDTFVYQTLRDSKALGIRGLKMWKNISLGMKDAAGRSLAIDDPRLDPIWQGAAEFDLPILIHIADPVAFFRPIDGFNERYENLQRFPEWSFYGPEFFSFEELMEQQENLIAQNPKTTFIVAHGGSYSENLGQVGKWLDHYPNMHIDIAARLAEFGRQPYTSRAFFNKYQDRILFGTDFGPGNYNRTIYYEFLETFNEYFDYSASPGQGRWKIYGIGLDNEVLEKVYSKNAQRVMKL